MTKIKLCGLTRPEDIREANCRRPDYVGFVFAPGSRRAVAPEQGARLRQLLNPDIQAVGVFTDEDPRRVAALLEQGIIQLAQLHGQEDEGYIKELRRWTDSPLIQAFRIDTEADVQAARCSSADYVLLDSGKGGTGTTFNWSLIQSFDRPFFLAGGLGSENVAEALRRLKPYGVDVSSGIETDGVKDPEKIRKFMQAVRDRKIENY